MTSHACELIREALIDGPYFAEIRNQADYERALNTMDEMIDDYDANAGAITQLARAIEHWEDQADEFVEFNRTIAQLDNGIALVKTLMDQYKLGLSDLPELGSKSNVSKLLNAAEGKKLTRQHIEALSRRFGLSPALFF